MSNPDRFERYVEYLKNVGGSPLVIVFDEDWSPIGPIVRADMGKAGLITQVKGRIHLVGYKKDEE